jgi:hypothetical protein
MCRILEIYAYQTFSSAQALSEDPFFGNVASSFCQAGQWVPRTSFQINVPMPLLRIIRLIQPNFASGSQPNQIFPSLSIHKA